MRIEPPADLTPEGWLYNYDPKPGWLPKWPASSMMALVCVRMCAFPANEEQCSDPECDCIEWETEAIVILNRTMLAEYSVFGHDICGGGRLFFKVPRDVLFEEGSCPGLSEDSFEDT